MPGTRNSPDQLKADAPVMGETLPELPPQYLPFLRLFAQAKLGDDVEPDPEIPFDLPATTGQRGPSWTDGS